ncbi:MAG TPA: nucleoside triphosphate pyrophosphohydrolase [Candidatus Dormibacteraeota bacterium]|nr:nucleoside triphosphate pyrophosphohydrolase [Candidatus Dormibacteraeota bacterium]
MSEQPYPPGLMAVFDVVRRLRAPDGCPWDKEQTHESLRPYLLEETYELLEAIDSGDESKLREELGDVLLQVAMHAQIAADEGRFDAVDISEQEAAKMVARHPHVFGDREVKNAEEVLRNWERDKLAAAADRGEAAQSVVDKVPPTLPALAWSLGVQKRAARVGFDYPDAAAAASGVAEEVAELEAAATPEEFERELGDLLFALVNLARKRKVNPEDALRAAGRRFVKRFKALEELASERGVELAGAEPAALEALWSETT